MWALQQAGLERVGWDLVVHGEVPLGAGLSSSAALESAVALAVATLGGADLDRFALAAAGRRAENEVVGAPVGIMDQAASLLCREGSALLLDCRSMATQDVALGLAEAGLGILVVDSRVRHDLADGGYADRHAACVAAAEALGVPALRDADLAGVEGLADDVLRRRARHVVTEEARVHEVVGLLRAGRPADVGPVVSASHASLRDDYEVSVPEVDALVVAAGAPGRSAPASSGAGSGARCSCSRRGPPSTTSPPPAGPRPSGRSQACARSRRPRAPGGTSRVAGVGDAGEGRPLHPGVRVTIDDVARAAGVSRQTVSRAMNGKDEISAVTRRRVLATIEELDYRPSAFARGMRTQRAGTLALILSDIANPFFPAVARGVFDAAAGRGLAVVVHNTDADAVAEQDATRAIVDSGAAGAIGFFEALDDESLVALGRRLPLVVADRRAPGRASRR